MHVTFGLDLDRGSHPSVLTGEDASMGFPIVGPRRFFHLLETHAGLLARHASPAQRIAAYTQRLAAADSPRRFFHHSLQDDAWGTGSALLRWRDALVLGGWSGGPRGEARIDDLSEVESVSFPAMPAGLPERTQALLDALPLTRLPVQAITHIEPLHLVPSHLRCLIEACRVPLTGMTLPAPVDPSTDLGALQRILLGLTAGAPRGDGTVLFLRAEDTWQAADALAAWLAVHRDELTDALIVRGGRPQVLDQALRRQGFACLGSSAWSAYRPATQVLPLAVAIAWSPLDPLRLLEFLTLPMSPLPGRCRAILARTFSDTPGVRGKAWRDACQRALEEDAPPLVSVETDDADLVAESDLLRSGGERRRKRRPLRSELSRKLETWLGPDVLAAHSPDRGIPRQVAIEIAGRTAHWAYGRARHDDSGVFRAAAAHATDLGRILAGWPDERIPRTQMEQILACVTGFGARAFTVSAEAGHYPVIDRPGAVLDDVADVIWWDFTQSNSRSGDTDLGVSADLGAAGITVDDPAVQAQSHEWRWRLPILTARRRVVLVIPADRPVHPLFHEIRVRLCPNRADEARLTQTTAQLLQVLPTSRTPEVAGSSAPLMWTVPGISVETRAQESASSLQSLLACPLQWFLRYQLDLRPGALARVSDGRRLAGQLAHAVFEDVFPAGPLAVSTCEAHNRAVLAFDRRLSEIATPFLAPHRTQERLVLREQVGQAAAALTRTLQKSNVTIRGMEVEFESPSLRGRVDLVLDAPGKTCIVDFKSADARHLRTLLEDGTALQLAVYSDLAQTDDVAFFSISSAELLTLEGSALPSTRVAGPSMDDTRERTGRALDERREQLQEGTLEIGARVESRLALKVGAGCNICDYGAFCRRKEHRYDD